MVRAFWGKLPQKGWIQHKLTLNPTLINKQRDNKQWGHFSLILYYKFRLCLFLACCDVLSVSINAEMYFRKNAEQKQMLKRSTTKRNKVGDVSSQTKSWVATSVGDNNSNIYFNILITCTGFSVRCSQLPQPPVRLQRLPDLVSEILNSPIVDFT